MIVYHGSTKVINHPEVSLSKDYLDFGKGFYIRWNEVWKIKKT